MEDDLNERIAKGLDNASEAQQALLKGKQVWLLSRGIRLCQLKKVRIAEHNVIVCTIKPRQNSNAGVLDNSKYLASDSTYSFEIKEILQDVDGIGNATKKKT